jgi:ABC-type branched-subunit amino acid transport system permease subunit
MQLDRTEYFIIGTAVVLAGAGVLAPGWLVFLVTMALAKGLVVQGVVMLMRSGLVSFGQGLYFCIGGYAVGMGGMYWGITDALVLLLSGLAISVALAMVLGLLLMRYREIFFAMLTLAFSMILYGLLVRSHDLGSTDGFNVVRWTLLGWSPTRAEAGMTIFWLTLACGAVVALLLHRYVRSGIGLACEAMKENEVRVEYLGVSRQRVMYINYIIAAAVAAIGGSLSALVAGHVDPEMAYWTTSGEFVFIALLAGTSHVAAPFLAAIIFAVVRTYALEFFPHAWQMMLGVTLLLLIIFLPRGIWSLFNGKWRSAT